MKKYVLFAFFAITSIAIYAQEKTITGNVSDENGPLPGVNILIKGTTTGTQSDFDGNYAIKANLGDKITFSFVGMKTEEKVVGKSAVINVILEADAVLDEVVVVAYGTTTRKSVTGSVSRVLGAELTLKGKVEGVETTGYSALVGSNKNALISGARKVAPANQPLYIINGVPVSQNSKKIRNLNSSNVKSVKVLKDAAATSIYGSRGGNGVIIISTNNNYESEAYKTIKENEFEHVAFSPLSTFSIDVDRAAYSNVRRHINSGQKVPSDAVKLEEMINYFNYDYKQPTGKHPFSSQLRT